MAKCKLKAMREFIEIQEYKEFLNSNGFEENKWQTVEIKRAVAKVPSLQKRELFKGISIRLPI